MDESLPERYVEDGLHPHIQTCQPYFDPGIPSNYTEQNGTQLNERIGGLRPRIFWLIVGVIAIVVIAASVGGAVGGARSVSKKSTSLTLPTISAEVTTASITSPSIRFVLSNDGLLESLLINLEVS